MLSDLEIRSEVCAAITVAYRRPWWRNSATLPTLLIGKQQSTEEEKSYATLAITRISVRLPRISERETEIMTGKLRGCSSMLCAIHVGVALCRVLLYFNPTTVCSASVLLQAKDCGTLLLVVLLNPVAKHARLIGLIKRRLLRISARCPRGCREVGKAGLLRPIERCMRWRSNAISTTHLFCATGAHTVTPSLVGQFEWFSASVNFLAWSVSVIPAECILCASPSTGYII